MKAQEKEYALSRLREIHKNKLEGLKAPENKELTFDERIALLRKGKIKVRAGKLSNWHTDIEDIFDWRAFNKTLKDPHEKKRERLNTEYQRLRDEIMLGEDVVVLPLLQAFMKFV